MGLARPVYYISLTSMFQLSKIKPDLPIPEFSVSLEPTSLVAELVMLLNYPLSPF